MRNKYLPIILILFINMVFCLFIVNDYGESWDEANMHEYASNTLNAYKNFFTPDKMQTYYDKDDDKLYYGPAFVMTSNLIVGFLQPKTHQESNIIYHNIIFVTFLFGLFFFYLLNIRFFPIPVAIANTLLFNTQPLIFGHSFINPKDIPIMVFFMGALAAGFNFIDTIPKVFFIKDEQLSNALLLKPTLKEVSNAKAKTQKSIYFSILSTITLVIIYFTNVHRTILSFLILSAYNNPQSLLGLLFQGFANNSNQIPISTYISKSVAMLNSLGLVLILLLIAFPVILRNFLSRKEQIRSLTTVIKNRLLSASGKIRTTFHFPKFLEIVPKIYFLLIEIVGCWQFWLAAVMLGFISSIRLVGPYAGVIIAIFLLIKNWRKAIPILLVYSIISFLIMYLLWPFLWGAPLARFSEAVSVMSNFQWGAKVLFDGFAYKANHLPNNYLPKLLALQFTEPFLFLLFASFIIVIYRLLKRKSEYKFVLLFIFWFIVPFSAIMILHTPMYDNFRHFLFIIPPLFMIIGYALNLILNKVKFPVFFLVIIALISPGIYELVALHPYQYIYYNSFEGGLEKAENKYELDYLGISSKEAIEYINKTAPYGSTIIIYAPLHLISPVARPDLMIKDRADVTSKEEFIYSINLNRFNWGEMVFANETVVFSVERDGAKFITVRKVSQ